MEDVAQLRERLIGYVRHKFRSRPAIGDLSDDIVNQAFLELLQSDGGVSDNCNFGYLSVISLHCAYRLFRRLDADSRILTNEILLEFLGTGDIVEELLRTEDTEEILNSLDCLKQVERAILYQRYFGDDSFARIAADNGIKLNTVLSHHRRALEKLRPRLTHFIDGDSQKPSSIAGESKEDYLKYLSGGFFYAKSE